MVFGFAVGILAGLAIAIVVEVGFSDVTFAEYVEKLGSARFSETAGAGLVGLLAFIVCMVLLVPVHEAGHLVAGLLSGYRFVSFRIFNYVIIRIDGKLRIKKYSIAGTGGQCLLLPPETPIDKVPTAWYNLGGVIANILVLPVLLPLAFINGHPYLSVVVWVAILADLMLIIINGIPMKVSGAGNDAYNALLLRNNPVAKRGFIEALKSNAMLQNGVRPKDMPAEWFTVPDHINYRDQLEVSIPLMAASRLLDQMKFVEGLEAWEAIYSHKKELIGLYVKEIECELVFLRLVAGDLEGAEKLLTPELQKYIATYSRMMSSKERILFTKALILDKDRSKANEILSGLKNRQNEYLLQGEVLSDIAIMETVLKQCSE